MLSIGKNVKVIIVPMLLTLIRLHVQFDHALSCIEIHDGLDRFMDGDAQDVLLQ